jgi:hypothetical protein
VMIGPLREAQWWDEATGRHQPLQRPLTVNRGRLGGYVGASSGGHRRPSDAGGEAILRQGR